jgi:hypothetical protein
VEIAGGDMITLTVIPEAKDYVKATRLAYLLRPIFWTIYALAALFLIWALYPIFLQKFPVSLLLPVLIFIAMPVLILVYQPWQVGRRAMKNEMMRTMTTYELDETQLVMRNAFFEQKLDWGIYGSVLETKEYIFLHHKANKNMFNFIPKRAFTTEQQLDDYRILVKSCIKTYKVTSLV